MFFSCLIPEIRRLTKSFWFLVVLHGIEKQRSGCSRVLTCLQGVNASRPSEQSREACDCRYPPPTHPSIHPSIHPSMHACTYIYSYCCVRVCLCFKTSHVPTDTSVSNPVPAFPFLFINPLSDGEKPDSLYPRYINLFVR